MQRRTMMFCTLLPLSMSLCAAGPPPEGVETRFSAGSGGFEYRTGGCGGPVYANRAVAIDTHAAASYRHTTGLGGAVDVSASVARNTDSRLIDPGDDEDPPLVDEDELNSTNLLVAFAPRVGYHHDYFGVEAGAFLVDNIEAGFDPVLLPSATAWVGVPRYVYVWGSFLEGPASVAHLPVQAGIGHAHERVRASLGVGYEPSLILEGSYQLSSDFPLRLGGRFTQIFPTESRGTLGAMTLAYTW